MKKTLLYITLSASILTAGSFTRGTDYDAQVNILANSIFSQIQDDVPPSTIETGTNNIDTRIIDTTNGLLGNVFIKGNGTFTLTAKTLNARLNGGMLSKDLQVAISFMYDQKLTKYNTEESFQANSPLRRDEAAKFFGLFAKQTVNKTEDSSKNCTFTDLAEGHTDLQSNMTSACKMGIFKGKNGFFNPTKSLTNGEALAVIIRIIYGPMDENDQTHRAKYYRQKAQTYGLTQGSLGDSMKYLDVPITRGDMARILEAARFIPTIKLDLGGDVSYSLATQGYVLLPSQ